MNFHKMLLQLYLLMIQKRRKYLITQDHLVKHHSKRHLLFRDFVASVAPTMVSMVLMIQNSVKYIKFKDLIDLYINIYMLKKMAFVSVPDALQPAILKGQPMLQLILETRSLLYQDFYASCPLQKDQRKAHLLRQREKQQQQQRQP